MSAKPKPQTDPHDLMRQGDHYYHLARDAQTDKDRTYWCDRLNIAIFVSRKEFGADAWVTKDLEGLRGELGLVSGAFLIDET
jgi:hypothetical protein